MSDEFEPEDRAWYVQLLDEYDRRLAGAALLVFVAQTVAWHHAPALQVAAVHFGSFLAAGFLFLRSTFKQCPECGAVAGSGAHYCSECGHDLVEDSL